MPLDEGRYSPEEILLLEAADLPALSPGLRARVLSAAIESQARQAYGRRALWAAGLLFAVLGLIAWRSPVATVHEEVAHQALPMAPLVPVVEDRQPPCPAVSGRYGKGELLASAGGNDWGLVEAEMESRREGLRHVRM